MKSTTYRMRTKTYRKLRGLFKAKRRETFADYMARLVGELDNGNIELFQTY